MTIYSESGPYGADAKDYGYINFPDARKTIDGELAKIALYEIPDQTGLIDPSKRNCITARFDMPDGKLAELSFQVRFERREDEQLALQIIESIKFDRDSK